VTLRFVALAMASALAFSACGGSDGGGGIEGENVSVEMYDNRYQYTEIRIPEGGTITWVGAGQNPHNAVDADGGWSTEDVFGSLEQYEGDAAVLTYDEPGEYTFFCTFHGNAEGDGMAGTLIVGG
jgi:plastocyanin